MTKQHSGRFSIVPARAVEDRRLGPAAFRALAALGTYSDRDGWCWPRMTTLAKMLGYTRQAAQQHIQELTKLGYIEVQRQRRPDKGYAANRFRLLFDRALFQVGDELRGMQAELAGGVQADLATHASSGLATILKNDPIERIYGSSSSKPFDDFWRIYPSRRPYSNPKEPARLKFEAALKRGVPASNIIRGAENFASHVCRDVSDRKFVAQAQTWLNQERWTDYQEPLEEARLEVAPL